MRECLVRWARGYLYGKKIPNVHVYTQGKKNTRKREVNRNSINTSASVRVHQHPHLPPVYTTHLMDVIHEAMP